MNRNRAPRPDQDVQADSGQASGLLVDGTKRKLPHEYTWQEREALNRKAAEKFRAVIDEKFAEVEKRDGHIAKCRFDREHEQRIRLDPSVFRHLRADGGVVAIRTIPGEEEVAAKKWGQYGGHRILMSEPGRESRQAYFLNENVIEPRGIFGPEPDEDIMIERPIGMDPGSESDLIAEIKAAEPSNVVEAEAGV